MESLEGKRGYPRIKPPFPAEKGSGASPPWSTTWRPWPTCPGSRRRAPTPTWRLGVPGSPGTKVFCVSGDVARPGFYEAELGITLRDLVEGFAGGVIPPPGSGIGTRAAADSGPSSGLLSDPAGGRGHLRFRRRGWTSAWTTTPCGRKG
ncbi:MAG: SLBB domain-containing protein [Candidatus Moduliflexus flocculans]|nr:SLBB domain-containing protein [Candidatus Moduliflexus flocculans]